MKNEVIFYGFHKTNIESQHKKLYRQKLLPMLEDELSGRKAVQKSIAPTLAAIREEIERLNQIITHYLSLSRIGGAEPEELGLGEVVQQFVEENRAQSEERNVGLRVRTDGSDTRIQMDPNQLRRVLVNLVENATDAVCGRGKPTSGRAGVVTLLVRRMRRSVKLTVKAEGFVSPVTLPEQEVSDAQAGSAAAS